MTEKRLWVRLALRGGDKVERDLREVGNAGDASMKRIAASVREANARMERIGRTAARVGKIAAAAFVAIGGAAVRNAAQTIDAQSKLAQSLGTSTESIQVLARAGELAGVSMSGIEQATKDLTRRLSQAAAGTGPAADALDRLGLSANELIALPLDQRVGAINAAIESFVPAAERAAVAGQLFGEEGSIAMSRIDTATLRQATRDVRDFGVGVSELQADQVETMNDSLSRLGMVGLGLANQATAALAPAIAAFADAMAAAAREGGVLNRALDFIGENIGRIGAYAAAAAALFAGRWVAGFAAAALSVRGLATALVVLRGAIIRTGIGILIVGAGELVYRFGRLVQATGGWGEALVFLGEVAAGVWEGIKVSAGALVPGLSAIWESIRATFFGMLSDLAERWNRFLSFLADDVRNVPGLGAAYDALTARAGRAFESMAEFDARASSAAAAAARLREEAAGIAMTGFEQSGQALLRLRAAVSSAPTSDTAAEIGSTTAAAAELGQTFKDIGAETGGAGGLGRATEAAGALAAGLEDVGAAAAQAGETVQETLGGSVAAALADYAEAARQTGQGIGEALTGAFQGAENAVGNFVTNGKASVSDLVTSMIADFARLATRTFITAPLANALGGVFGSLGGIFGGVSAAVQHAGGMAGSGPMRTVPALAFAAAPRMHSGGMVGLRPDEVPAILQRGERVLNRQEAAAYGAGGVTVNIYARDAESFRQSRTQVASDIARAVSFGRRGL